MSSTEVGAVGTETGRHGALRSDRWVRRRITLIWALLLWNALPWIGVPTLIPIPQRLAQLVAAAALGMALVLALGLNRGLLFRPNVVLSLFTVLLAAALMAGVRGTAGPGAVVRSARFAAFLAVLWLLTPWWGRRDLLLARCHLKALSLTLGTVVAGLLIAPSVALGGPEGRLVGALWPIWPTAVAHLAASAAGMAAVLWLSGNLAGRRAAVLSGGGVVLVLLSHTRVALVGLTAALLCAAISLVLARQRVRRAVMAVVVVAPVLVVSLAPAMTTWFSRGQSTEEIRGLTGRKAVWSALLAEDRPEFGQWFGSGLSDRGFFGRPIDNSWLALYHEQGLVGVTIVGMIMLFLLLAPAFRDSGPARALIIFIVVYCGIDSYTEVGLGDASPYLLDLAVAASLVFGSSGNEETTSAVV